MAYWLFLPLAFSTALLTWILAGSPRRRGSYLLCALILCVILNAASLLVAATTNLERLALWASLAHSLLAFSASGVLLWLLALELAWGPGARPAWVKGYTMFVFVLSVACGMVIASDHLDKSALFYGPLAYPHGLGYVRTAGPWAGGLQFARLVSAWGALGILAWSFWKTDRRQQVAVGPVLVSLLVMPVLGGALFVLARRVLPGADVVADFTLVLTLGYAASRYLFPATGLAARQIVDSMADGVVVLDVSRRVVSLNRAAERLLGVTWWQVVSRSYSELFASWRAEMADVALLSRLLEEDSQALEESWEGEFSVGRGEAHRRIRLQVGPIFDRRGQVLGRAVWLTDVTAIRDREERLQEALAEQRQLAAALTELSSPVLPVMEHTIVLPLVGRIDTIRANLVSNALLGGIKTHRARVVILDLTGVQILSAEAVSVLWQAIDAAQLLGAEPILVGIQPQVAAALSDLDVDMRSLIFQTDLRAGLMYAAAARPVPAPL